MRCMDGTDLVEEREKLRAVVNTVMNLRVPYNVGISWLAEDLLASQEGLCSMELVTSCTYANLQTDEQLKIRRRVQPFLCGGGRDLKAQILRDDDEVLWNPCRSTGCRSNCSLSCVNNKIRKAINLTYVTRSNWIFDFMSILNGDKFLEIVAGTENLLCIFRKAYWSKTSGQPWHTLALRDSSICVQLGIF